MTSQSITRLFSGIFSAAVFLVLIISCQSIDPENPQTDPGNPDPVQGIVLQVDRLVTGLPNGSIRQTSNNAVEAVVTILTEDGRPTDYNLRKVTVNHDGGVYKTEIIHLPAGDYQIATFYVLGADNKVSEVTPSRDSPLANQVDKALPYPFAVSSGDGGGNGDLHGEEVAVIVLPAIATEGRKPEDFGLHSFLLDINDVFPIFVALVGNKEVLDFQSGKLYLSGEGYEYVQNLRAHINKTVPLPALGVYDIKVESKGFEAFEGSFSMDSLMAYASEPLIIEMQKETIKCVGGNYLWNVVLESQTDIDNFSLRCHTQIDGDLIIKDALQDDPIVDLTPLSKLTFIGGSLEIRGNNRLESLEGLQNVGVVDGLLTVSRNGKLKTLDGLKSLGRVASKVEISNNPSLIHLQGMQNLSAVPILFVHGNNKLNNLAGLERLTKVNHLDIAHNESLNSLHGLQGIKQINQLTITGNNELLSLDGFDNGVESVEHLEMYYNFKLEGLTGMLSPGGKIKSSMRLVSTSVTSLEGLSFPSEIPFGIHIEDSNLKDLSGLRGIEKIGRNLIIASNINLEDISALENLSSVGNGNGKDSNYQFSIYDNRLLEDFCPLTKLFTKGIYYRTTIKSNGYNPTVADIQNGNCRNPF